MHWLQHLLGPTLRNLHQWIRWGRQPMAVSTCPEEIPDDRDWYFCSLSHSTRHAARHAQLGRGSAGTRTSTVASMLAKMNSYPI